MIIDMSCIRISSNDFINNIIFEMKMRGYVINRGNRAFFLPAAGILFMSGGITGQGLHSYEFMDHVRSGGDIIGAMVFGLLPVLQQLQINDYKMAATYVKNRKIA